MRFYDFALIRSSVSCIAIAETLYRCTVRNGRTAALWRGGDNPESVAITEREWYDHRTKTGGGPIELAAFAFNGDRQAAQQWIGDTFHLPVKMQTGAAPASPGRESRYEKLLAEGYKEVARYEYRDLAGAVRHFTVRLQHPEKPGKEFVQGHENGDGTTRWTLKGVDTVLYRLPEIAPSDWVLICEGEKSADRLAALGIPSTTAPMGAGKWHDSYSDALRGKDVAIFPDNDAPGTEHAALVARALHGVASTVKIVDSWHSYMPAKAGIDDWLDHSTDRGPDALHALIADAPEWHPAPAPSNIDAYTGPTPEALAAAKQANSVPFRNYVPVEVEVEKRGRKSKEVTKEPRGHAAMLDDLFKRFLGFPRKVGDGRLFDYDRDSGTIIDLDDAETLLAWIARRSKHNPDWSRGDATCSPRQFRASVLATCERYESISVTPDWPTRPDVYYAHGPLPAPCPQFSRFNAFCAHFLPASDIDAALIRAFACCPLWYVPGLPRPSWIIDSHDGQGSGKSNLVELVAELYGHPPVKTSKQELSTNLQQLTRRCLSNPGRNARIMLVDNVTGDFQSPELADLITSKHITGMAPYGHGEECRPNNLVYTITANSATVSTDLADRSIYIHVRKPSPHELAGWKDRIQAYIAAHRMEIFSDIIAMLSAHMPFPGVAPTTRFPEYESIVLQPCCGSPETLREVLAHVSASRSASNIDEDMARLITENFRFNVAKAIGSAIEQAVFIRSELVNSWGRQAIADTYEFHGKPAQLVRNLAKIGLMRDVDRDIAHWPPEGTTRHSGVAWCFTDSTETAIVIGRDGEGQIFKTRA